MRTTTIALALGLSLAGCVKMTASNELAQVGGGQAAHRGTGVILFGFESAPVEPPIFWSIEIRRLDPGSRRLEAPYAGAGGGNHVAFRQLGGMLTRNENYAAFTVVPGEYAITRMVPMQEGGLFVEPNFSQASGQAASMGVAGLAGLIILGTAAVTERSAEEARFGQRGRSPLVNLTEDGTLTPEAPRFTVKAGEVVYLGEFLFGAKRYFDRRRSIGGGSNTDDDWTRVFASPFVEHMVDENGAGRDMQALGLRGWQLRSVQPSTLANGPVYFAPYLTRDRVDWLSAGDVVREDVVRARPAAGRMAAPAPQQALPAVGKPTPAAPADVSDEELRRRFLAGEVSVEQYRAAAAARR